MSMLLAKIRYFKFEILFFYILDKFEDVMYNIYIEIVVKYPALNYVLYENFLYRIEHPYARVKCVVNKMFIASNSYLSVNFELNIKFDTIL